MCRRPLQGEWQEVGRNSRRRNPDDRRWKEEREIQVTKFFVGNLPDNCSREVIKELFGEFGTVSNVYIARKRDSFGNQFGFVSFTNVYDGLELQRKLARLAIGNNKLKVNIAKYAVENFDRSFLKPKSSEKEKTGGMRPTQVKNKEGVTDDGVRSGMSYRDKLLNLKKEGISSKGVKEVTINPDVKAFCHLYGKALIGKVSCFETLRGLKELLRLGEWGGLNLAYLGGLHTLVSFDEEVVLEEVLRSGRWKEWFSEMEVWKGKTIPFERLAWTKVIGVPLHVCTKDVFELIGRKFGEVVYVGETSIEDGDLSSVCVGILVNHGDEIKEEIRLKWKNLSFSAWIREEVGSWIPDGMGRVEPRSEEQIVGEESESDGMVESESSSPEESDGEDEETGDHGESEENVHGKRTFCRVEYQFNARVEGEDVLSGGIPKAKPRRRWKRSRNKRNGGPSSNGPAQSGESPRPKKRNRCDDIFNLEALFGARPDPVVMERCNSGDLSNQDGSIDLNKSLGNNSRSVDEDEDRRRKISKEVEATKEVGVKLGVNLDGFEKEIEGAILEEGIDDQEVCISFR